MTLTRRLLPGATLGVFGGGQLGRMFTLTAARLGYRVVVFSPERDSCAGQVAHEAIRAEYDDHSAVQQFAERCDGITLEFENVPVHAVEIAGRCASVRPARRLWPFPRIV